MNILILKYFLSTEFDEFNRNIFGNFFWYADTEKYKFETVDLFVFIILWCIWEIAHKTLKVDSCFIQGLLRKEKTPVLLSWSLKQSRKTQEMK